MKAYDRIFGTGPRGFFIGVFTFLPAWYIDHAWGPFVIADIQPAFNIIFIITSLLTIMILGWSIKSLPVSQRGRQLVTSGAFRYVRHPLYAAFVSVFNPGFALWMNSWVILGWVIIMIPLWHWNIAKEEQLVREVFGREYDDYCRRTGRFFPKLF